MEIAQVAGYLNNGRIIDLTLKMNPGSTEGSSAKPSRRYEMKMFEFEPWKIWSGPGEIMHYVDMESHVSTHVEAPSHYIPARYGRSAPDLSEMPLSSFFGSAVLIDCQEMGPQTPIGVEILKKFPICENDIVLFGRGQYIGPDGDERSFLVKEGAEYLNSGHGNPPGDWTAAYLSGDVRDCLVGIGSGSGAAGRLSYFSQFCPLQCPTEPVDVGRGLAAIRQRDLDLAQLDRHPVSFYRIPGGRRGLGSTWQGVRPALPGAAEPGKEIVSKKSEIRLVKPDFWRTL